MLSIRLAASSFSTPLVLSLALTGCAAESPSATPLEASAAAVARLALEPEQMAAAVALATREQIIAVRLAHDVQGFLGPGVLPARRKELYRAVDNLVHTIAQLLTGQRVPQEHTWEQAVVTFRESSGPAFKSAQAGLASSLASELGRWGLKSPAPRLSGLEGQSLPSTMVSFSDRELTQLLFLLRRSDAEIIAAPEWFVAPHSTRPLPETLPQSVFEPWARYVRGHVRPSNQAPSAQPLALP